MSIEVAIKYATEVNALNRSARSVTKIADQLERVARNEKALQFNKLRGFGRELTAANTKTAGLATGTMGIGTTSAGAFGLMSGGAFGAVFAVSQVVSRVLDLGAALVRVGIQGAASFGKMVINAGMFRENTLATLSVLLKSKDIAKDVYVAAAKFAAVTPYNTQQVIEGYKGLLATGFKVAELETVFKTIGDLAAAKPDDPTAMPRLVKAFGDIRAAGKLNMQDLRQIANVGLPIADVYGKLAEKMGMSVEEVMKAQRAGKITSDVAISAILEAADDKFGGTMKVLSAALSGLWSTLVSKPFELLNSAFDKGGGLEDSYDAVKAIVKDLGSAFYEDDGTTLTSVGENIVDSLNDIGHAAKEAIGVGRQFFEGFFEGMMKSHGGTDSLRDSMGNLDLEKLGEEARKFGGDVAIIADGVAKLTGEIVKLGENKGLMFGLSVVLGFAMDSLAAIGSLSGLVMKPFMAIASAIDYLIGKVMELRSSLGSDLFAGLSVPGMGIPGMPDIPGGMELPDFGDMRAGAMSGALDNAGGDTRAIPVVNSDPGTSGPGGATGDTINHNSVSVSVSGGMMPAEIAALVRREVDRAMDQL